MSRMFEGAQSTIASLAQWAEESRMVGREMWEELHRTRSVDGVSVSALARRFGLDRKTVRRCLSQSQWRPFRGRGPPQLLVSSSIPLLSEHECREAWTGRLG